MDFARVEYVVDRSCHYLATSRTAASLKKAKVEPRQHSQIGEGAFRPTEGGVSGHEEGIFFLWIPVTFRYLIEEKVPSH